MYQHTLYRLQQHAVQKLFFLYRPQPLHVDLLGGDQVLGHGLESAMHFVPFYIRYFQHNIEGMKKIFQSFQR